MEHIKISIQELDPTVDPESAEFFTAVVVMAAAFAIGRASILVQFTGYSMTFVANIARRMRANELWNYDEVCTWGWFEGGGFTVIFWSHCLAADGLPQVDRDENGERVFTAIPYRN